MEVTDEMIEGVADKIIQNTSNVMELRYSLPEYKHEAELALRAGDLAIVLWNLLHMRGTHKHVEDDEEFAFWDRFSTEVYEEIESRGIMHLIDW